MLSIQVIYFDLEIPGTCPLNIGIQILICSKWAGGGGSRTIKTFSNLILIHINLKYMYAIKTPPFGLEMTCLSNLLIP